jgi:2-methylcitrate dehydratase
MDKTTQRLVEFALEAKFSTLSTQTLHECNRRLIDAFASALAAYDEPLCIGARAIASRYSGCPEAHLWGSPIKTSMEAAAFANGVMLRYLDISDTYLGKSRGHPSDMLSGVLAAAEHLQSDGPSVITAIVLAYDVYCSFADSVDINSLGWDQPVYAILGSVVGVAKLMGLNHDQMGHAISLALTPNLALLQTRHGDLSAWKGCAGPNAARNAIFACLLAQQGFTGPAGVFEGKFGFYNVITAFDWKLPSGGHHKICDTHIKSLPVCYHGQSSVLCAMKLRTQLRLEDIQDIHVESYGAAFRMMGNDPTRWAPTTRETADHSMPYVIALALADGKFNAHSFSDERLKDLTLKGIMSKVRVSEDSNLSAQYPEGAPGRVTIRTHQGKLFTEELRYPTGHAKSPMSDADVEQKFRDLVPNQAQPERIETLLKILTQFEQVKNTKTEFMDLLVLHSDSDH